MEDTKKTYPSLPPNYVTIVDLEKRWTQQQLKKQQQQEKERNQKVKNEKDEEPNHNLRNKDNDTNNVKRSSQFQNLPRSKSNGKPKFATGMPSQGNRSGVKPLKMFRVVEKVSDLRVEASEINVHATRQNSRYRESNRLRGDGNRKFVNGRMIVDGRNPLKKVLEEEKIRSQIVQASGNSAAVVEVETEGLKVEDEKKLREKSKGENKKNPEAKEKGQWTLDGQAAEAIQDKGQVTLDDQTAEMAEIEVKLEEVVFSGRERKDERSSAAIEGSRRVHWGYNRNRKSGKKKREVKTEKKNLVRDTVCVEEIDNQGGGGGTVGGQITGGWKSTATVDRGGRRENRGPWSGERRGGYTAGEHRRMVMKRTECVGLMWVKKGEASE